MFTVTVGRNSSHLAIFDRNIVDSSGGTGADCEEAVQEDAISENLKQKEMPITSTAKCALYICCFSYHLPYFWMRCHSVDLGTFRQK
jgi:hypothetical protein